MTRNPKGTVVVSADRGMLRIRLPRHLFGGHQKNLYLNLPDTPLNRAAAQQKAQAIAADIAFERFDFTLGRYQPRVQDEFDILLGELWQKYTIYKMGHLSVTTINKDFGNVASHIARLPSQYLRDARRIRQHWVKTLSPGVAKKTLVQINACCQWAVDEDLIPKNPFFSLPKIKTKTSKPKINPFTRNERDKIISGFERRFPHYADFAKFLFWTGADQARQLACNGSTSLLT
jgi:integrase